MKLEERIRSLEQEIGRLKQRLDDQEQDGKGFDFSWFWVLIPILGMVGWIIREIKGG